MEFVLHKNPNLKTTQELLDIINYSKEFPIQDFINCFETELTGRQIEEMLDTEEEYFKLLMQQSLLDYNLLLYQKQIQ